MRLDHFSFHLYFTEKVCLYAIQCRSGQRLETIDGSGRIVEGLDEIRHIYMKKRQNNYHTIVEMICIFVMRRIMGSF